MIMRLSTHIANFIRRNNPQAASMDVLMFSLEVVLNAAVVITAILFAGLVTGNFGKAAILLVSYIALRFFSGGVHLPTSKLCNIISIAMFLVLIYLPVSYWNAGFVLNCLAFFLILIYAPTKDIMHLNLLGPKYTMHFKVAGLLMVGLNFWLQMPSLALAFFAQTLSLTPAAYKAVHYFERR